MTWLLPENGGTNVIENICWLLQVSKKKQISGRSSFSRLGRRNLRTLDLYWRGRQAASAVWVVNYDLVATRERCTNVNDKTKDRSFNLLAVKVSKKKQFSGAVVFLAFRASQFANTTRAVPVAILDLYLRGRQAASTVLIVNYDLSATRERCTNVIDNMRGARTQLVWSPLQIIKTRNFRGG